MKNYFEQISQEELCEVFNKNGYFITNLDRIYGEDRELDEEPRQSLFVLCRDTTPDPIMDKATEILSRWSMFMGSFADDYKNKIFTVGDFFIDEICPLQTDQAAEERLHALNKTYHKLMSSKFPTYRADFQAYCETLANEQEENKEM
jgi:hypothetical protein